ncbi:NAD(P)-dependent oxidoreductase [Corynebacterium sp. 153RC1]|uniref:NAD(P)-dependent oxidoreductase n=1 Tax=unclassified Corynebacterium TaxID=2624378 RepID=UPI00211C2837|nr:MULTISPECIES: NAD(P)-dependent oxidoreductase [unclassified Corynebacterium]MCQ9352932.1 NAD(P)-dependent oxidoreductase [Corynebacterium sp. 209RC1]MCQ9353848.1 NAD(P)-dependent oxidoreductase [Corynebacterium sp. 1222RC1]MCQ9356879.1 NAD(P)-dependent oxidoreductase [Corynebacterium sp. 122RC1]MCQ9358270.1 NAD(P)-dependent oxidoreductase [Corynebacterium sp. 142RC1]MCQ9361347.1 NAD(P)-dependent oxidoreductase [Corynebacterium sp. 153RC1]
MKIAFLGTGRLGTELALQLLKDGHELTVWNRSKAKTQTLADAGAGVTDTAEEAVTGAELVVSCLFDANAVQEVIVDPGLIPDGVAWADASTVAPKDTEVFAAAVPSYVATPVVGTLGPARNRALGVYVGSADAEVRQRVFEVVKVWGETNPERVKQVDTPRQAAAGKLIANLALAVTAQGFKEALLFGESQGVDAQTVVEMLGSTGLEFIRNMKSPFVLGERDTAPGDFTVDAIAKDVRAILTEANLPLPAIAAALQSFEVQQENDRGDHDFSEILVHRADRPDMP